MTITTAVDTYITDYAEAAQSYHAERAGLDPQWLTELRESALAAFSEIGLPTKRRGNEEYKYTDIRPILRQGFSAVVQTDGPAADAGVDLERLHIGQASWHRLVFIDGRYSADLSNVASAPAGVTIGQLADAIASGAEDVRENFGRLADYKGEGFAALNTAFAGDGAFLYVPPGVEVAQPIHILFVTTEQSRSAAAMPRTLIIGGADSKASIIETHVSASNDPHFTNAVTEIVTGAGSSLSYCKIQQEGEASYNVSTTQVEVNENVTLNSMAIDIGGRLTRNNLNIIMAGEGASSDIRGVYVITRDQHVDNQVIIDHVVGHNDANEVYKGILDGKSRSVFHGSIIVRPHAAKVNAMQVDKNLLLSNDAEADTKPAFWIYCDDVRCGHGAACGELDDDAMFYLLSRGVPEEEARMILIRAFSSEVVDAITEQSLHDHVAALIAGKLDSL